MADEQPTRAPVPATPPLSRRLAALPEPAMRASALATVLNDAEPPLAVALLDTLIREARAGDKAALAGYASLVDPDTVGAGVSQERKALLCQVAEDEDCGLAQQWLESAQYVTLEDTEDLTQFVHRDLRKLPLGNRRALARQARGEGLKKLLMDPDPGVIGNLLNNPQTTEQIVIAVCARRPTIAAPLVCVLRASRWNQRYKVKRALLFNPAFPARFGVNLLVYLNDADLASVRDDEHLAQSLRLAAKRLLDVGRLG